MKRLIFGFSSLFLLLELLLMGFINYIGYINIQVALSNALISSRAQSLIFRKNSFPELSEFVENYSDITVFAKLDFIPEFTLWGICGSCQLESEIERCVSGEFFQKEDFFKQKKKAVVGENVLSSKYCTIDETGKRQFYCLNEAYEIAGVFSSSGNDMLKDVVFINLDAISDSIPSKITIDAIDKRVINRTITELQKEYTIDLITENDNFVQRYILYEVDAQLLQTLVMILIGILMIVLAIFILYCYHKEIRVRQLLGLKRQQIYWELLKNILCLTGINTAIGLMGYTIFYLVVLQRLYFRFYIWNFLIYSFGILVIIAAVVYLYLILSYQIFHKNGVK